MVLRHGRATSGYSESYFGTVDGRHSTLNHIQGRQRDVIVRLIVFNDSTTTSAYAIL